MEATAVQFRLFKGEVIAVFPYEIDNSTNVMCYAHYGQHSGCCWNINNFSKAATEAQYLPLKTELEQIGYNLKVIKKRSHKTYLKSFYSK